MSGYKDCLERTHRMPGQIIEIGDKTGVSRGNIQVIVRAFYDSPSTLAVTGKEFGTIRGLDAETTEGVIIATSIKGPREAILVEGDKCSVKKPILVGPNRPTADDMFHMIGRETECRVAEFQIANGVFDALPRIVPVLRAKSSGQQQSPNRVRVRRGKPVVPETSTPSKPGLLGRIYRRKSS